MLGISPEIVPASDTKPLERETNDLEALHLGLRRHLAAWRTHYDQTTDHAIRVIERIDHLLIAAGPLTARNTRQSS